MKFWLLLLALGSAGEEWYLVNSLGQPLRSLPWFLVGDQEWVVRRDRKVLGDQLFLYHKGRLVERRERAFWEGGGLRQLSVFRNDLPAEEEYYDPLGKLIRTVNYLQGNPSEEQEYLYREDALVKVTTRDPQGLVVHTDEFFRNPDGRLRRVVRTLADGTKSFSQWTYGTGGLVGEWTDSQGRQSLRYLDASGRLKVKEDFLAGASLGRQEWGIDGDVPVLKEKAPGDLRSQGVTDSRGRLIRRDNYVKDVWISAETWTWEDDRLVREERIRPGRREVWTYEHTPEGELLTETLEVNGKKDHVLRFEGGSPVKEEIFDQQGELVLEAEYTDGKKVRETYYRSGEVIRTREIKL